MIAALLRLMIKLAVLALALAALLFAWDILGAQEPDAARGDGIVVLTGGPDRIETGLRILAEQRARRMLISGVNPATSDADLRRAVEAPASLFDCCVDLGRRAATTRGNAAEAAEWSAAHDIRTLLVVTAAAHVPRAMAEFNAEFAQRGRAVTLIPVAVRRPQLMAALGELDIESFRTLAGEFVKFGLTRARILAVRLGMDPGDPAAVSGIAAPAAAGRIAYRH